MTNPYEALKHLAHEIRRKHGVMGCRVLPGQLKKICKAEGVHYIDLLPGLKKCKGAYFNDADGISIVVKKGLPIDPCVFTLAHELKHHLTDRDKLVAFCQEESTKEMEVGAEVFAAELLFPDALFVEELQKLGVPRRGCKPTDLVHLKVATKTTLSYTGLAKKAVFLKCAQNESDFKRVKWQKLQEEIYGVPFYKQRSRAGR